MSDALAEQLYNFYAAGVYPVLAQNDPEYQRSLVTAGLGWQGLRDVPAESRNSFQQAMKMQAWLGARKVTEARSLDPDTVRVKVLTGPLTLYRVAQSGAVTPPGIWWFSEKVAERCREEAGSDPQKRLDWLRNVLAVCFNWSRFDRIERLALHSGEKLPAVLGRGLSMPHYKIDPSVDRTVPALPPDYWQKKGEMLLGGELQIVLPWIPVRRVSSTESL
ncbi:MAG: hypothetical protein ABI165_03780 [Bryobacteraceae bacterium]